MKYFKSFLFDLGLLLIVAGIVVAQLSHPAVRNVLPVTGDLQATYQDYDLTAPAGLVVSGLIAMIIGATKTNSRM